MTFYVGSNMPDRVCAACNQILKWAGTPTNGQYRHCRVGGVLYVTTHAPDPVKTYKGCDE